MLINLLGLMKEKTTCTHREGLIKLEWPHHLKNDIGYVFLFGLDLDFK